MKCKMCGSDQVVENRPYEPTMTVRDEFAKAAMQGILSNPEVEKFRQSIDNVVPDEKQVLAVVETSYMYADAMLAEKKRREAADEDRV
jgi:hypothetical protein